VAGDFACAEDLDVVLEEPIRHLKQRLAGAAPAPGELDALIDRICADQSALGR